MTIEEIIKEMLIHRGIFPEFAADIVESVKADKANDAMQGRWGDDPEGYPPAVMNCIWLSTKKHALEWIDTNSPKAFIRALFTD